MRSLRQHLASTGLAVLLCHVVMQVLVPAAICCSMPSAAERVAEKDCCAAGAHPGQICPMHARSGAKQKAGEKTCKMQPRADLHQLFVALSTIGGVIPAPIVVPGPDGLEHTPAVADASASPVTNAPPGPPPRA